MSEPEFPVQNIPRTLREVDQWLCWKIVVEIDQKTGERKERKVPIHPRSGLQASVTDPSARTSFDTAFALYQSRNDLTGVGFVFTPDDPYAGVDLDHCLDAEGGFIWGREIVAGLNTYSEISPSGRGIKLFLKARKPDHANCRKDGFGPDGKGKVEVYDRARFFTVTAQRLDAYSPDVEAKQGDIEQMCEWLWPKTGASPDQQRASRQASGTDHDVRYQACLKALLAMNVTDHNDGSHRLYVACCRCVEHDLRDADAIHCIRDYAAARPFPVTWSDPQIVTRLRDAEKRCERNAAFASDAKAKVDAEQDVTPLLQSVDALLDNFPVLREPIIEGLLRVGETMNVIAPPKLGKSWLVTDLAIAVATGRQWLDTYQTHQGNVLLLDNELHAETSANRIPKVARARQLTMSVIGQTMFVDNQRGRLRDINRLEAYFEKLKPGFFKIIILDAFYRFLPKDTDENSNGNLTDIYNQIDQYAADLNCSFVLVHHASKGNQSGKSVTDVGAGAGSQSRATDTHMVLRHHQEPGCVVVDAAVRSWPPIEPKCLRWEFPVWLSDDLLDPTELKTERPARRSRPEVDPKEKWTPEMFAKRFVTEKPQRMTLVRNAASSAGVPFRIIKELQAHAEEQELIFRWKFGANKPVSLATEPQPVEEA